MFWHDTSITADASPNRLSLMNKTPRLYLFRLGQDTFLQQSGYASGYVRCQTSIVIIEKILNPNPSLIHPHSFSANARFQYPEKYLHLLTGLVLISAHGSQMMFHDCSCSITKLNSSSSLAKTVNHPSEMFDSD